MAILNLYVNIDAQAHYHITQDSHLIPESCTWLSHKSNDLRSNTREKGLLRRPNDLSSETTCIQNAPRQAIVCNQSSLPPCLAGICRTIVLFNTRIVFKTITSEQDDKYHQRNQNNLDGIFARISSHTFTCSPLGITGLISLALARPF